MSDAAQPAACPPARLRRPLPSIRPQYQLNQEKLDYNYRVLVERDSENSTTIKQQKKKLTRMADVLSSLKAKYAREEKRYRQENQDLTEGYKRSPSSSRTCATSSSTSRSPTPSDTATSGRCTRRR